MTARSRPELRQDLELMLAIRDGSASALEALYDRHSGAVLGLCTRVLRDHGEAEETLVDVFHQIWKRAERFDPARATPLAYLMAIARSRAIDRLRMRQRRSRLMVARGDESPLDALPMEPIPATSGLHAALARELRERVQRALARLRVEQRHAVELSFFEGLSHREIAERLDIPLGTIKTRIRQGLIRLRDLMRSYAVDEEVV